MKPAPGMRAMFEGAAYEFLFLVRLEFVARVEYWRARPLFVDQPDRTIEVPFGARLTPLHSKGA